MRPSQPAVDCSHPSLGQVQVVCVGEGLKRHDNVQVRVLFTELQHGYIHLMYSCSKSCRNAANLDSAQLRWRNG